MRVPRITGAVLLALLGVALAAGITYAASTVVSTPIGLSSESTDVGQSLAPRTIPVKRTPTTTITTTTTTTTTQPAFTTPTTTAPSSGHGGDGDHDADDD